MLASGCAPAQVNDQSHQPPNETTLARQQYTIVVEVLVGTDGLVKDARIALSSGNKHADEAALREIKKARMTPGTKDGQSTEMWSRLAVTFKPTD